MRGEVKMVVGMLQWGRNWWFDPAVGAPSSDYATASAFVILCSFGCNSGVWAKPTKFSAAAAARLQGSF